MTLEELRKKALYQNSMDTWIVSCEESNEDWSEAENYKKPMKDFLSSFMDRHRDPEGVFLQDEENRFKQTCDMIISKLGERPLNPKGPLNPSKFDSVFIAFAKNLPECPENIKEKLMQLERNAEFESLTSDATTDTEVVKKRLSFVNEFLFR